MNDVLIRRNIPIPARNTKITCTRRMAGPTRRLEVYLTQGESTCPLDCTILGKYVFTGIHATDAEVMVDVGLSYDANGVVQVQAVQRDTGHRLALQVEPVPDDLSWLGRPPEVGVVGEPEHIRVFLLIDVSSSMIGEPLAEAQKAAREFLDRCDFTTMEVGLISFSSLVALQAAATSNVRRLNAAIHRLEAEGSTNLTDALEMARGQLVDSNWRRYIVILTDGYPDAPESAVEQALAARGQGIDIVAIGTGAADRDYLGRLASSEHGVDLRPEGELVQTFGHIARMIAEGGRGLRVFHDPCAKPQQGLTAPLGPGTDPPCRAGQGWASLPPGLRPGPGRGPRCALRAVPLRRAGQADSVYLRDALAGTIIGGSIGFFLNAWGPLRDGAWRKLARSVSWGVPAAARSAARSGWSWARW